MILHTSGSTGRPKRVPLSHANLSISAGNVARSYGLTSSDVSLCVMPLFHVHGLVASTLATLATGGTVVVPAKFNPLSFWRVARDYGVTWYSAVPTLHQLLLARAEPGSSRPAGAEKLRFIRSCSASLPPQVMHDLEAAFGAPVLEAYGMTEAAHQMASNPLPPGARKPGSVGPGTDVRISIMDGSGRHLNPGERGEVVIQGPNVINGYESNAEANATSFIDGWFRTGDQGFLDADGYLTLVGRLKELINRGGEKISPREIDEVLLAHPAVAEAVCFGVPHPTWGEEVAAAVVLREAATEVGPAGLLPRTIVRLQASEADSHHRHDSAHRHRQDSAAHRRRSVFVRRRRENRHCRRRRDRRLHRRAAGPGRRRRRPLRPRPASAGDAGARTARDRARTAISRCGPRSPAISPRSARPTSSSSA